MLRCHRPGAAPGSSRTPRHCPGRSQSPLPPEPPIRLSLLSFVPPLRQSVLFPRKPKIILVLSTRISSPIITRVLCDTKAFFPRPCAARRGAELRAERRQPEGCAPLRSAARGRAPVRGWGSSVPGRLLRLQPAGREKACRAFRAPVLRVFALENK